MERGSHPRVTAAPADTAFELEATLERWALRDNIVEPHERVALRMVRTLVQQTDHADASVRVSQSAVIGNGPHGQRFKRIVGEIQRGGLRLVSATDDDYPPDAVAA